MVEFEFLIFDTLLGTKKPQTKQKLNTHSHFCMLKRMRIENQNGLIVIIIRSTSQPHWTIALMLVGDTRASSLISFVMLHQSVFFSPSVRFIQAYCDLIGYFTIIIPLRNHSKLVGCFCCYYYGLWRTKSALATGFACLRSVFDRLKVKRKQSSKMKMRKNTNVNYIAPFPVRWKTIAVKIFVDIFFVLCVYMIRIYGLIFICDASERDATNIKTKLNLMLAQTFDAMKPHKTLFRLSESQCMHWIRLRIRHHSHILFDHYRSFQPLAYLLFLLSISPSYPLPQTVFITLFFRDFRSVYQTVTK